MNLSTNPGQVTGPKSGKPSLFRPVLVLSDSWKDTKLNFSTHVQKCYF